MRTSGLPRGVSDGCAVGAVAQGLHLKGATLLLVFAYTYGHLKPRDGSGTTTTITKPNDLNIGIQVQHLEKTTFHESNKVKETNLTSPDMVVAEDLGQKHIHDFDETAMLLMTDKDDNPGEAATDGGGEFNDHLDEINLDLSQQFVIRVLKSRDVFGGSLVGFFNGRRNMEEKTAEDGRTSGSDRGITIWDPEIKSAFQDNTLRA
ncbi:hypothetical protein Tco_0714903, partial [Tanacetum coccineum]